MILHPIFAEILAAFQTTPPRPLDLTGATDGYLGNFHSLPVGQDEAGRKYLTPGSAPDFTGLKETAR